MLKIWYDLNMHSIFVLCLCMRRNLIYFRALRLIKNCFRSKMLETTQKRIELSPFYIPFHKRESSVTLSRPICLAPNGIKRWFEFRTRKSKRKIKKIHTFSKGSQNLHGSRGGGGGKNRFEVVEGEFYFIFFLSRSSIRSCLSSLRVNTRQT